MNSLSHKLYILCSIIFSIFIRAAYCDNVIMSDNFESVSNWQSQGNGEVNVSSGKCNFANVYCGAYNRVYRDIGVTLSDEYWRAECDFSILNTNPTGFGTGEVVLALTAGTLDFMSYDSSQYFNETFQDGIAVILLSNSSNDNNINNWYFLIEGKKGQIRNFDLSSVIFADSSISNYFLRLERTQKGTMQLSIFSDSTFTTHIAGSPVKFEIDSTITGLNTIQHGTITPGYYTRFINATVDNDFIYDDVINTNLPNFENTSENTIFIYPNPSNSVINITNCAELKNSSYYTIYNISGVKLTFNKLDPSMQIDISYLPIGVYLITLSDSKKTYCAKFQKYH